VLVSAFVCSCASEGSSDSLFGSGGGPSGDGAGTGDDTAGEAGPGSATASSASTDGTGGGPLFDIGDSLTAADDGGPGEGCEKIDFLFVVDNSGSMGAHQSNLIASFGPFMDTIFSTVQGQDYHIMVVDSDADRDLQSCEPCPWDASYCGDYCDVYQSFGPCEGTLGAGEVQPYNNEASNEDCGVPGGLRYLTSDLPQAQIKDTFACMAKVGIFGSGGELPMSAMVEAVTTQIAPGACNEGFLRDDAVLVVTVITDDYPSENDDDASTVGTPMGWYDALVAAKNGKAENIVMLGILNLADSTCVQDGSAGPGPAVHPTQKFLDFVALFGIRGIVGDVCSEPDYGAFFGQAVTLIDTACDEFEPEG
jgi:hypothetical protein